MRKRRRVPRDPEPEPAWQRFGHWLRSHRTRHGLTLTAVESIAFRCGFLGGQCLIDKAALSRLENGRKRPDLDTMVALSYVYDIPLARIVGRYVREMGYYADDQREVC